MHILNFLKKQGQKQTAGDFITCEYRLLCSGTIYNSDVLTADWRKSDVTRLILISPFTVFVASHPFDDYPQELALRFTPELITKERKMDSFKGSMIFYPDEEIARDIAALLSLFCRRLITVSAKIRETHPKGYAGDLEVFRDWPIGFVNSLKVKHWEREPATVVYGQHGVQRIIDYNPDPKPISSNELEKLFLSLPSSPYGESIVNSARLYALALERIGQDVDIAYQLLIAGVETIANDFYRLYAPTESEMIKVKKNVADLAIKLGLREDKAKQLAIEACKGMSWHARKFSKFLIENTGAELWTKDDLFKLPKELLPKKSDFEAAINEIYQARGKASHSGGTYPAGAHIGTRSELPAEVFWDTDPSERTFPPIAWFERAVNSATMGFMKRFVTPEIGQEQSSRVAEKERILKIISEFPGNVQDSLRKLVYWTARFLGAAIVNPYAPNTEWADGSETITILKKAGIIGGEGNDLQGSSWLKDREIGEFAGEFVFGAEANPFRDNELLLPRGWSTSKKDAEC
jgi:hypothetical protein